MNTNKNNNPPIDLDDESLIVFVWPKTFLFSKSLEKHYAYLDYLNPPDVITAFKSHLGNQANEVPCTANAQVKQFELSSTIGRAQGDEAARSFLRKLKDKLEDKRLSEDEKSEPPTDE